MNKQMHTNKQIIFLRGVVVVVDIWLQSKTAHADKAGIHTQYVHVLEQESISFTVQDEAHLTY